MPRYLLILLVFGVVFAGAGPGFGWGLAAHAYIAERALPPFASQDLLAQARYGAMLADLDAAFSVVDPASAPGVRELTHVTGCDLTALAAGDANLEAFAAGLLTHNEVWGADYYAHIVNPRNPAQTPGYVLMKAATLTGLRPTAREEYVEAAIDLQIRRKLDGKIGTKVVQAARGRAAGIPDLLAAAYSPPVDAAALTQAELVFQGWAIQYGDALRANGSFDKFAAASVLGQRHGYSFFASLRWVDRAMSACAKDLKPALAATIAAVAAGPPAP